MKIERMSVGVEYPLTKYQKKMLGTHIVGRECYSFSGYVEELKDFYIGGEGDRFTYVVYPEKNVIVKTEEDSETYRKNLIMEKKSRKDKETAIKVLYKYNHARDKKEALDFLLTALNTGCVGCIEEKTGEQYLSKICATKTEEGGLCLVVSDMSYSTFFSQIEYKNTVYVSAEQVKTAELAFIADCFSGRYVWKVSDCKTPYGFMSLTVNFPHF